MVALLPTSPLTQTSPWLAVTLSLMLAFSVGAGPFLGPKLWPYGDDQVFRELIVGAVIFFLMSVGTKLLGGYAWMTLVLVFIGFEAVILSAWAKYGYWRPEERPEDDGPDDPFSPDDPNGPGGDSLWWRQFEEDLRSWERDKSREKEPAGSR